VRPPRQTAKKADNQPFKESLSMKKAVIIAVLIAAGMALSSTLLFSVQGGFGGGHGDSDWIIFVLGLPWAALPWPEFLIKHDFVWLIALPFVLNFVSILAVAGTLRFWRDKPQVSTETR
jgi:hypothetical protein